MEVCQAARGLLRFLFQNDRPVQEALAAARQTSFLAANHNSAESDRLEWATGKVASKSVLPRAEARAIPES